MTSVIYFGIQLFVHAVTSWFMAMYPDVHACFVVKSEQAVKVAVELPVIRDTMTLTCRHYNLMDVVT